jgi:SAM-dependent methyltransferase
VIEHYIHGFSTAEQRRLTLMQRILNHAELAQLDLTGVRSLLDVGSGLGQLARELARALGPGARVIGVEREARQRAEAERQAREAGESTLVEFRDGDATSLPLTPGERGCFDLAHARFLLEHLRDPAAVVREMVSAVRPGGRVVLVDDDHELRRLWPPCPEMERLWRIYWESYGDAGTDPLVGRRLCALLLEGGARPVRVASVFYGAVRGMELFDPVADNLVGVIRGAAEGLFAGHRITPGEMQSALTAFGSWRCHEAATIWYSLPLAEGLRPAS